MRQTIVLILRITYIPFHICVFNLLVLNEANFLRLQLHLLHSRGRCCFTNPLCPYKLVSLRHIYNPSDKGTIKVICLSEYSYLGRKGPKLLDLIFQSCRTSSSLN